MLWKVLGNEYLHEPPSVVEWEGVTSSSSCDGISLTHCIVLCTLIASLYIVEDLFS